MSAVSFAPLSSRGLRPITDLAASRPHGDRMRYLSGCRCDQCRRANAAYQQERMAAIDAGDWNGIVPAEKARKHIIALSKQGIGRRSIAAVSDVAQTTICEIKRGTKKNIRAMTERRILAVSSAAAADHSYINAGPTWALINKLLEAGFTKTHLAHELGRKTHALQLKKDLVTVRNAYEVKRMYDRLIASDEIPVDAALARSHIKILRAELISARQIARELDLEQAIEDGEIRLPHKIPRALEKRVVAMYQRYQS